ncbi:NADH:flavin oxidoreductase/NADH oxidase family protein-like protein [Nemania diffusa]|nr:NADH:flavin oxidoreductase/NADH oxidase family protein-like protein [Nemania diffusa]
MPGLVLPPMAESRLFKPLRIGNLEVKHRIGMAPLTRFRATINRVPTPLMKEYYGQRAAVPGTLIISEATFISQAGAGGFPYAPGIWSEEQVSAWKPITDEVHSKGSYIFCQITALGRTAEVDVVGPSAIPLNESAPMPRAMTIADIKQTIQDFVTAAENAIRAGFDGIEFHGASGFLIDQFAQDVSNQRDDEYGGSVENRSRFIHELMKAVIKSIGPERVALRLTPWSTLNGMTMENQIPQYEDIIKKAGQLGLAYLHLIEARLTEDGAFAAGKQLDFAYKAWNGPILVAGGYEPADAQKLVDKEYPDKQVVVIFGRHFISNPDLVYRIKEGLELNAYDRDSFYTIGLAEGYVDYPFSKEYLASYST